MRHLLFGVRDATASLLPQLQQAVLRRHRRLRVRPPRFFRESKLALKVFSREENEGDEILGRAGDGLFRQEHYVAHTMLVEAQVAVVITDVAIVCVSTAPHNYYTVLWRIHFKGVLQLKSTALISLDVFHGDWPYLRRSAACQARWQRFEVLLLAQSISWRGHVCGRHTRSRATGTRPQA